MRKYQTEQRKKLIAFFKENIHKSYSAQEIRKALLRENISLSAVYRNLNDMENEGLVCKIKEEKSHSALYQYIDPVECAGIIHLKCQSCDATFHLNRSVSQMLTSLAKEDFAFEINDTGAFLYGKCKACSQIEPQ